MLETNNQQGIARNMPQKNLFLGAQKASNIFMLTIRMTESRFQPQ